MPYDIDAAEDWLGSWAAGVSAQADRTAQLSQRVAALDGTAENADGSIRVTVGAAGQVERLQFDDRVQRLRGAELADEIMAVIRRAQADLSAQVAAQVDATVGADTEAGRAVLHSFQSRFPDAGPDSSDGGAKGGR